MQAIELPRVGYIAVVAYVVDGPCVAVRGRVGGKPPNFIVRRDRPRHLPGQRVLHGQSTACEQAHTKSYVELGALCHMKGGEVKVEGISRYFCRRP